MSSSLERNLFYKSRIRIWVIRKNDPDLCLFSSLYILPQCHTVKHFEKRIVWHWENIYEKRCKSEILFLITPLILFFLTWSYLSPLSGLGFVFFL